MEDYETLKQMQKEYKEENALRINSLNNEDLTEASYENYKLNSTNEPYDKWKRLIYCEVNKYWRKNYVTFYKNNIEYDDLAQQGNLGYVHALYKFDASKGYSFSTYLVPSVNHYMQRILLYLTRKRRKSIYNSINSSNFQNHANDEIKNDYIDCFNLHIDSDYDNVPTPEEVNDKMEIFGEDYVYYHYPELAPPDYKLDPNKKGYLDNVNESKMYNHNMSYNDRLKTKKDKEIVRKRELDNLSNYNMYTKKEKKE